MARESACHCDASQERERKGSPLFLAEGRSSRGAAFATPADLTEAMPTRAEMRTRTSLKTRTRTTRRRGRVEGRKQRVPRGQRPRTGAGEK